MNRAAWKSRSPFQPSAPAAGCHSASAATPLAEVSVVEHVLDVADQPVVLGVEDLVDGGQADVLVDAAVAGDEVRVEHLVVVGAGRLAGEVGGRGVVRVRGRRHRRRARVVVGVLRASGRRCARCRSGTACRSAARSPAPATGVGAVALDQAGRRSRTAAGRVRAGDELAVRVGGDHRDVRDVRVARAGGRARRRLLLDRGPGGHAAGRGGRRAAEQLAGGDRLAGGVDRRTRAGTPGGTSARCRSGSGRPRASRC